MKLTAKLAFSQVKINRNRSIMTLLGIILSTAMLTAVCGFAASAKLTLDTALGYDYKQFNYNIVLIIIGTILGSIIIAASVIVVSNAFRVSAGERMHQFGILKSVGATKKQIAATVLYEGVFLSGIGIPIGILIGLLIDLIGTSIITNLLHSLSDGGMLNVDSEAFLTVSFTAPPYMFAIAILISFGTVLISAWLPARKAAKVPAINAILNAGEVRVKRKNYHTSKIIKSLFGFEGVLAAKSLKRSRRSFRATVLSLTISIVLLIVAGSFGSLMERSTSMVFANVDATALVDWSSNISIRMDDNGESSSIDYLSLDFVSAEIITEKLREYSNAEVFGSGGISRYEVNLFNGTVANGALISIDTKHYEELCKIAGVTIGSNILVNLQREVKDGKRKEYVPYNFSEIKSKPLEFLLSGHEPIEIIIDGELTGKEIPNEINLYGSEMVVIVQDCEAITYSWFTKVDDVAGFVEYAKQVLSEFAPQSTDEIGVYSECLDIADAMKQIRSLVNTIMFFVYGFIIMLILIAVTSVISTISTNIRSRAKEFAVLESIGMTKSGMKKMLNLESILCSVRSLIFGIPLGLIGSYALYIGMEFSVELPFEFPYVLIIECIVGVFVVTWITMRYSARKLKSGNIIETIRRE